VVKRRVLEQKLLLTAYRKSNVTNEESIGIKMNDLNFCLEVVQGHVNHCDVNISKTTLCRQKNVTTFSTITLTISVRLQ